MKAGIVGLPNVGKSTLFSAITKAHTAIAPYPFTTIDPFSATVIVPDSRLDSLVKLVTTKKVTYPHVTVVDIAGLIEGASKGEGLGNQFLAQIRDVDIIIHVVRVFKDDNVSHVCGVLDLLRDVEIVKTEMALSDISHLEKKITELEKLKKSGEEKYELELNFVRQIINLLNQNKLMNSAKKTQEEENWLRSYNLLSNKAALYVVNIDENSLNKKIEEIMEKAFIEHCGGIKNIICFCAKLEAELAVLTPEEQEEFKAAYGLKSQGIEIIKRAYDLLDIITFYTFNENELRGWTISSGSKAPKAAGKVHTDMEKGFIKAETISYEKLAEADSLIKAREMGWLRMEGKDYIVQDGDILQFKFNIG